MISSIKKYYVIFIMSSIKLIASYIPKNVPRDYIHKAFTNLDLGVIGEISIKEYKKKWSCMIEIKEPYKKQLEEFIKHLELEESKVAIKTKYGEWKLEKFVPRKSRKIEQILVKPIPFNQAFPGFWNHDELKYFGLDKLWEEKNQKYYPLFSTNSIWN